MTCLTRNESKFQLNFEQSGPVGSRQLKKKKVIV